MAKPKYKCYVVWEGQKPGIYNSWDDCQKAIFGYPGAKFKGFYSWQEGEIAFAQGPETYYGKEKTTGKGTELSIFETEEPKSAVVGTKLPILDSITVDAACSGYPGPVEYKGVHTRTKQVIFHQGPFAYGNVNLGEFLAIVHALAYCEKNGFTYPIYSDSLTARSWVKKGIIKSQHPRVQQNKPLWDMVDRALLWLQKYTAKHFEGRVLKWETTLWGENPADFGRK
ncbi:MAG: ribonuclease H family protein [Sphingobacteriales bacterium]|nr:ribonuclease H family protein [Sphingobacteriales bacterium]